MSTKKKHSAALALVLASSMALTAACSNDDGGTDDATKGPDGTSTTAAGVEIPEAQRVGAMADFAVGTTFKATEPVTFGMLYRDHPNYPLKEDWLIFQELKSNQNVSFDITSAPLSDWDAQKSLIISAGDAPDLITVTYPGQETQFVAGGALLPISDYVQYMPNFQARVKDWGLGEYVENLRQADGKYYMLPGFYQSPQPQYSMVIRKDVWDAAGVTEDPATWDDFKADLEKVKAAHPDGWAYSDRWSTTNNTPLGATLNFAAPNFNTMAGWGFGNGLWYDQDSKKFEYAPTTQGYKDLVGYFADLVAAGLLDPESVTQDDETAVQKFTSGESQTIAGNTQEINTYRTSFADAGTDAELRLIRVPAGPGGDNVAAGSRTASGFMLSSKVKDKPYFQALLQFVDWLYYSDEGLEFAKWGVEGTTFTKDGGKRALAADVDWNGLNPGGTKLLNADFGFSNGVFMLANGSSDEEVMSMSSDEVVEFVESMADKTELPLAPTAPLDEMAQEQVTLLQSALNDSVVQNTAAFILGKRPMSDWDAWLGELKGLNVDQYVETYNQALANRG